MVDVASDEDVIDAAVEETSAYEAGRKERDEKSSTLSVAEKLAKQLKSK